MHASVMGWVARQVDVHHLRSKRTLEVGAYDVNGSARRYFDGPYVGTDMRDGPGVDVVVNAHHLDAMTGFKDPWEVVVCTEMLEHDDQPWASVRAMHEVAEPGAFLLVTARGYDQRGCFPVHDYPLDLWRFSCAGLVALLRSGGWRVERCTPDPEAPGAFAVARA
jgi:hypothetical protein